MRTRVNSDSDLIPVPFDFLLISSFNFLTDKVGTVSVRTPGAMPTALRGHVCQTTAEYGHREP